MKTETSKNRKIIVITVVILLILAIYAAYRLIPKRILGGHQPSEITRIDVEGFPCVGTVTLDETERRIIADNLYQCGAKRDGISFGRTGYVYQLMIYADDDLVNIFSIIDNQYARDSFFFYEPEQGNYCFEYLNELSEKYGKKE